jgi:hypothetical protein
LGQGLSLILIADKPIVLEVILIDPVFGIAWTGDVGVDVRGVGAPGI